MQTLRGLRPWIHPNLQTLSTTLHQDVYDWSKVHLLVTRGTDICSPLITSMARRMACMSGRRYTRCKSSRVFAASSRLRPLCPLTIPKSPIKMSPQPSKMTVIEVVLSEESGMRTTQQAVTFTPILLHAPIPPTHLARHDLHEEQERKQEQEEVQSQIQTQSQIASNSITTLFGTRTLPLPSSTTPPPASLEPITTSTTSGTTTALVTVTRAHRPAYTTTATSYIDQWPQIGFIPTESDIPRQWRETYEEKALRQQYISLGCISAIFVVGVVGVLGYGVWKCFREGRTGRRERAEEREGKWDWF